MGVLPALVWAAFAVWAIHFLAPQIIPLLGRLRSFKGLGIELDFVIDKRLETAATNQGVTVALTQRAELRARLALVGSVIRGLRILWVDDVPESTIEERALLSDLGAQIQQSLAARKGVSAPPRINPAPSDSAPAARNGWHRIILRDGATVKGMLDLVRSA